MKLSAEQLSRFHDEGVLTIPNLFNPEELAVMERELGRLATEYCPENYREAGGEILRSVFSLHTRSKMFAQVVRDPRLLGIAQQILGDQLYIQQTKVNVKASFGGDQWQWHSDFDHWQASDEIPEPRGMNFGFFFDEVTEFNGPMVFAPKSHKKGRLPSKLDETSTSYPLYTVTPEAVVDAVKEGGIVSAKGPPGTGLLFHPLILHASSGNISPFSRRIFTVVYNHVENRKRNNKRPEYIHGSDFVPLEVGPQVMIQD